MNEKVELDVFVKVSSTALHSLLIHPDMTFQALREIRYSQEPTILPDKVLDEIGSVLYGAVKTNSGLITIMADLSAERYEALQPRVYKNDMSSLWEAFSELVENVLVPLATCVRVVHPDIRPGYDLTSNVLLKEGSKGQKIMKLIDYESLVRFSNWEAPNSSRYLMGQDWDAITFVWWQCVAMAFFWNARINITPAAGEKSKMDVLKAILLEKRKGPKWLQALRGMAARKVTAAEVGWTLTELAKVFRN